MEKTKLPWAEFFSLNKDVNHTYFTPEDFSGDEELIAKTTEQFVKQEIVSQMENIEQHNYKVSRQLFEKAGELGLLSIEVPEEYALHILRNERTKRKIFAENCVWRMDWRLCFN